MPPLLPTCPPPSQGKTVVRLKGGCPAVFSRLHSELAALGAAGVRVEVVPGVSSALAAPLAAGAVCKAARAQSTLLLWSAAFAELRPALTGLKNKASCMYPSRARPPHPPSHPPKQRHGG